MNKVMISVLAVVVLCGGFFLVRSHEEREKGITQSRIQKSVEYWESVLNTELPAGTAERMVQEWGERRQIQLGWSSNTSTYHGNVDKIPDTGFGFPCSEWHVLIDIVLGKDGAVVGHKVHSAGDCL